MSECTDLNYPSLDNTVHSDIDNKGKIIDFVALDRELLLKYKGKRALLEHNGKLEEIIIESMEDCEKHPITKLPLSTAESNYIKMHIECYLSDNNVDIKDLYEWYETCRTSNLYMDNKMYKKAKLYLTITDFQSHFKMFTPHDAEMERYERAAAENILQLKGSGWWLMRHSSYNRSSAPKIKDAIDNLGARYYALSYMDNYGSIQHVLLYHMVGKGWYIKDMWYPSFIEYLEYILMKYKLSFNRHVTSYVYQ